MHVDHREDRSRKTSLDELKRVPLLRGLREDQLMCLAGARTVEFSAGELVIPQGSISNEFWLLVRGQLDVLREEDGPDSPAIATLETDVSFGEFSLLSGLPNTVSLRARVPSELIRLGAEDFWTMMSLCPAVRRGVLGNMATRLRKMQNSTIQQEKMATLGTMAAGLMHELNNPGTAAKRATSQLRETLLSMQRISTGLRRMALSAEQQSCLEELQAEALAAAPSVLTGSLEQTDAEEALAEWIEQRGLPNGWEVAPTLVAAGMTAEHLECAAEFFPTEALNEVLAWISALSSSLRLVTTVEESIGRVSDLVHAVKHYAFEGRGQKRTVDVNESIRATLLMLGHKIREKNVTIVKHLDPSVPAIESSTSGLNQIWTNLLDNALDASHPGGHIAVETSREGDGGDAVVIRISDDGGGIPQECQAHIFEPFFTTKDAGTGTGLGLGIVHRIVELSGGTIRFTSSAGTTEFLVRLPATRQ